MGGIQALSSQVRLSYDDALFSGNIHRMVFNVKTGEFWTEEAPKNFSGRALLSGSESESIQKMKKDYLDDWNKISERATSEEKLVLEIPIVQRKVLNPANWTEIKNNLIFKQKFSGNLVFAQIKTNLSSKPLEYQSAKIEANDPENFAYLYFFPSGISTSISFWLGFRKADQTINDNAPKYTLNLNTLTGQLKLLQGFEDANFQLSK